MADAGNLQTVRAAYDRAELAAAIRAAGIGTGDVVSLQVSLGRLGLMAGVPADYAAISDAVIDTFLDVIGPQGTLLVPTYTYSIGRGDTFDVDNTPAGIGEFPERFRRRPGVLRSRDPMLSNAALGPKAEVLLRGISNSCYGAGSTFERLRQHGAKICTLGISLYWATFRHHIEEMANVPFRYRKIFQGLVAEGGKTRKESWIYYAAPYVQNCQPNGLPLERIARERGLVKAAAVGRGEVMAIDAQAYYDLGRAEMARDPWLTAEGPAVSIAELVRLEDQRVGAVRPHVPLEPGATAREMINAVWNLPRDLVSDGYDAALEALARQTPMQVHEYPTGTECWSWIVPEKWQCRAASLETEDGKELFSYAESVLRVPSYAHAVDRVMTRDELLPHLMVHPVLPDVIPYHYLFYKREWGLCVSKTFRDALPDGRYRVKIDSAGSFGTLKVGEIVVPGESEECIVLCGHLDHPGQVNDGLSGAVAGVDILRRLAGGPKRRFTYRMIVVPETIGSLAWLSHNEHLIPHMAGGIFLEMIGLGHDLTMQHSYNPDSPFDRCAQAVLQGLEPGFRTGKFLEVVTNDDRQFNAPGVRVPMISLSRVEQPCGRDGTWLFNEYHSELDNPDMLAPGRLEQTIDEVIKIFDAWESNYIPEPLFRGEVYLSRYSIFYDYTVDPDYGQALFETMHALDGKRSIADIVLAVRRPFETVFHIVEQFRTAGLVRALPAPTR